MDVAFVSSSIEIWVGAAAIMAGAALAIKTFADLRKERRRNAAAIPLGFDSRAQLLETSRRDRLLAPILGQLSSALSGVIRPAWLESTQDQIARAGPGSRMSPMALIVTRVLLAAVGVFSALRLGAGFGFGLRVSATVIVAAVCWALPSLYLARLADARVTQVNRELPDLLDQITISLSAGLGIDAAISRVAERSSGVLSDELRRTMADIRVGIDRGTAFENLSARCQSEDLDLVTSSIVQGLELGTSLTPILVARATELRRRRRAYAEEQAHKLSVKLSIPTAVCILPALLLVVIGPAIIQVMTGF